MNCTIRKYLFMKTKVIALVAASVFALSASAQEVQTSASVNNLPGKNVAFQLNPGDNWFISARGGANYGISFYNQEIKAKDFSDRLGYEAGVGFGKWYTPYFASRVMLDWAWVRDMHLAKTNNTHEYMFHTLTPHIDFMFDPANYFGVYNASRTVRFVPYIGVGVMSARTATNNSGAAKNQTAKEWLKNINYAVSGHVGFDLSFRLGQTVDLVLAPSVVFSNIYRPMHEDFYRPNNMLAKLDLGLNFNLGKSDFDAVEPMDYALLNNLQNEINSLRAQNAELSKRPVRCPECPEVVVPEAKVKSENVVYFRIGSARVDRNQKINIYNTAEFVKSNNIPVTVIGYADAKTGSSNYNLKLSEKRAREVARILTDEYGVPSSQITIDYKGDAVQPYAHNAWNRVVIMTAEK